MNEVIFMGRRRVLRGAGFAMLAIAAVFVAVAVQNPQLGTAVRVGRFTFGAEVWRVCYGVYLLTALGLLAVSFLPGKRGRRK